MGWSLIYPSGPTVEPLLRPPQTSRKSGLHNGVDFGQGSYAWKYWGKGMDCHHAGLHQGFHYTVCKWEGFGFISSFKVGFLFVSNSFKIINRKVLWLMFSISCHKLCILLGIVGLPLAVFHPRKNGNRHTQTFGILWQLKLFNFKVSTHSLVATGMAKLEMGLD